MNSLKYWFNPVLQGWLVIEGLAVLAFFFAGLPGLIAVFLAALITGLLLDEAAGRARFDNGKYWLRALAIAVLVSVVQLVFGLLNISLLPWLQFAVIVTIAYLLWDGFLGKLEFIQATQEDALQPA